MLKKTFKRRHLETENKQKKTQLSGGEALRRQRPGPAYRVGSRMARAIESS